MKTAKMPKNRMQLSELTPKGNEGSLVSKNNFLANLNRDKATANWFKPQDDEG